MEKHLVVIGGGYAGILAAVRAAKLGKDAIQVTLVNDRDEFIERIRLHEHAVRGRRIAWSIRELLDGSGVQFRRAMVTEIDFSKQVIRLNDGEVAYDRLILAAGSETDPLLQPPGAREHANRLDLGTAHELRRRLHTLAANGGRVTVCGGGLVGVELSAEIAEQFPLLKMTLMTSGEIAPLIQPAARAALRRMFREAKISLHEHTAVKSIERDRIFADEAVACDLCITTAGMRASPLVARSGLATNARGQALIDPLLRAVGRDDVYVIGDAAAPVIDPGSAMAMGCKYGMPMAAQAAANAVAGIVSGNAKAFDFDDTHFLVSVGRRRGLVQLTHQNLVITGRMAAVAKEIVCRSTLWALRWERHPWFNYPYLRTGRAPQTLPVSNMPSS